MPDTEEIEETQSPGAEEQPAGDTDEEPPDEWAEKVRKTNSENQSLRERLRTLEEEAEERRKAEMSEHERALEEAKASGYTEAESFYKSLLAKERIISRAAGDFSEPKDVLAFLDVEQIDIDDDHAIDLALTNLAKEKPYLLSRQGQAALSGSIDQGPTGPTGGPPKSASDWLRSSTGRR